MKLEYAGQNENSGLYPKKFRVIFFQPLLLEKKHGGDGWNRIEQHSKFDFELDVSKEFVISNHNNENAFGRTLCLLWKPKAVISFEEKKEKMPRLYGLKMETKRLCYFKIKETFSE